jgi:membrane fusion protein, multidrug efflux system
VKRMIWVLPVAAVAAACSRSPEPEAPPRPVLVRSVGEGAVGSLALLSGEVRARHEADLAFRLGGKVVERRVDVGAVVRKGQVLARLDPQDVELAAAAARAAVAAAESDLTLARVEYERARDLRARNFISGSVLDARTAALQAAQARFAQARAQAAVAGNQTGYASLLADGDGVVTAVLAEPGQVVGAGQAVLSVARLGEREILLHLPESRRRQVTVGTAAEIRPWADSARRYVGRVREVAPAADATTRTYAVRVSVVGADESLPLGATAVALFAGEAVGQVLLPLPAVTRQGEDASVWVVDGDGVVQPRPVEVVAFREDGVLVKGGLAAAERVVVAGVHTLVPGQKVRVVDERAPVALDVKR